MRRMAAAVAAVAPLAGASGAFAHPHAAEHAHGDAGQVIANGQNHPAFINGESCETFTHLPGYGPAGTGSRRRTTGPTRAIPGGATAAIRSKAGSRRSIQLRTAIRESNSQGRATDVGHAERVGLIAGSALDR
jgi:hypothetical protein